jgi:hypothetical protein
MLDLSKKRDLEAYAASIEDELPTWEQDGHRFAVMKDSDGDAILFAALLSTVWESETINWPMISVIMSQGTDGMFYRSPRRRATGNAGYSHIFSRDMDTGVMAAATQRSFPHQCWSSWLSYIDKSRPCKVKKPKWAGGGCLIRSPIYYYAPDDRSQITPECWAMMGRVAEYRGFSRHSEMDKWDKMDGDAAVLEAENCELGYQLHLKALDAYIKLLCNQSREYSQRIGQICWQRVPDNLFYKFLATRSIDDEMYSRFFEYAPKPGFNWGNGWVWQSKSVASELPYSSGWDFLFLAKLFCKFG